MDNRIFSCMDHIDELMGDLLDQESQLPIIEFIQNEEKCVACTNKAVYQLVGRDVEMVWESE